MANDRYSSYFLIVVVVIRPPRWCWWSASCLWMAADWMTGWLLNGVIQAGCIIKRSITKLLILNSTCTCSVPLLHLLLLFPPVWCYGLGVCLDRYKTPSVVYCTIQLASRRRIPAEQTHHCSSAARKTDDCVMHGWLILRPHIKSPRQR